MEQNNQNEESLEIQKAIARIFNTDDGKFVLNHWFNNFMVLKSPIATDTHSTAYNVGQADFVRQIYAIANFSRS